MPKAPPPELVMTEERAEELGRCFREYTYFINKYCRIYDSVVADWIPFRLWSAQIDVLDRMHDNQLTIILKARQLGISWLTLSYGLWTILFRPIASVSVFSRRETEAIYMLSNERLRGIYNHLPPWMRTGYRATVDSGKEWILSNGSAVRAFPTSAGDSYVSTLAIMDEADLAPDLNLLMGAVKPTIDTGGKLVLLSRSNKTEPNSEFKRIYRAAKAGENGWCPVFLPWYVHPQRDELWYERQKRDVLSRTGSLDDLHEQYPACLTADSLVSTEQGILPIAEALLCETTESGKILKGSIHPPSPIYRLETRLGRVLRGTADHPIKTVGGFIELAQLQSGMRLELCPPRFAEAPFCLTYHPLPGLNVTCPITPSWGRWIGYFMGDGSWHVGQIEFVVDGKDEDVLADLVGLTTEIIGKPNVTRLSGHWRVRVGKQAVSELFYRLGLIRSLSEGGKKVQPKRWVHVPDCIFRSPLPVVREFLRGLFESDGSSSGKCVTIASKHEKFMVDVQLLLLGFGINSRKEKVYQAAGNGTRYPQFRLRLTLEQSRLFVDKIGFVGLRKQKAITDLALRERKNNRGWWSKPNELCDEVVQVVEDGVEETYNFTIEGKRAFSANGILTHNTDAEALSAKTLDKRISPAWLITCFEERKPTRTKDAPALPGLEIYIPKELGKRYVIGADPAEGNPTSDDSSLTVVDIENGQEAASLAGKFEPSVFASYIAQVSAYYNYAPAMVERNNHGHSVIQWLEEHGRRTRLLLGHDAEAHRTDKKARKKRKNLKPGWLSSRLGKTILYTTCAEFFRTACDLDQKVIFNFKTYTQLCSIEASSLSAPAGEHDDRADSYALAIAGREQVQKKGHVGTVLIDSVREAL